MQRRAQELSQVIQGENLQQSGLVEQCLEGLQTAMEELQVAQEELRQKNEEVLRAQETADMERQRYQELFELMPAAYLVTDLYGTVREANHTAASLLEISCSSLIGKPLVVFVPSLQRRSFRTLLNRLSDIMQVQFLDIKLDTWKKNSFQAEIYVDGVRNFYGQVIALRWLVIDVTARKQAELHLREVQRQNLELREADRLKDEFMRMVSHELRTPMNAILGFSELLLQRFSRSPDSQNLMMVQSISRNSRHLLRLIEELLDFSRLQTYQLRLNLDGFDLTELLQSTAAELHSLSEQKDLAFHLILPTEPLMVFNDRSRLHQVIVNLVANAIKFTHEGSVTVELVELPEGRVAIGVRDTGIGIAPEHQAQIFQDFWQVDQSSTRRYPGTGLGLAISRRLVALMRGSLTVESEPGQGSLFRIELPRTVPLEASLPSESFH